MIFTTFADVKKTWTIQDVNDYARVFPSFLGACGELNKWKLFGEMGAGKTTFVHQLGIYLGLEGVNSPTFSIVNSYDMPSDHPPFQKGLLHHMDLYRLKSEEELLDMGWEEYVYGPDGLIVEWPALANDQWPLPFAEIHIQESANISKRELILILRT